jgi:hypothetical protein
VPGSWYIIALLQLEFEDVDDRCGESERYEIFKPHHAKQILDFFAECQRRLINLCVCQCDAGISRSAGAAAALSYIVSQGDTWVFTNPRYLPNRLVYRTILDVYYRDHEHPPYHKLEGQGYTYLGSMVENLNKFDLYLYRNGGEPVLAARYDYDRSAVIRGDLDNSHPILQEARRRAEAAGLLDDPLF